MRLVVSKGPPPRPVPQLTGLTSEQARSALQAAGFVADIAEQSDETVPKDRVMSWSPQGTQPKGTTITVVVSSGPPTVAIPDLTHDDYNDAANQLKALGVTVVRKDDYSDDEPNPGKVISTLPAAGSSVPKGSKVTVVVSKGPKTVTVPTVTGTTLDRAKATVVAAGLTVGNVYGPDKGRFVVLQTPSAGDNVPRGSSVDLYVAGH